MGTEGKTLLYDAEVGWWDTIPRFVAYGMSCHQGNMWSCLELITVENLQLEKDIAPEDLVEEYKVSCGAISILLRDFLCFHNASRINYLSRCG